MLTGGCYCGFIRYDTSGRPTCETNCHCSICRRVSGAAFVTWFTVPKSTLRFLSGNPTKFSSTERGKRTFCPRCGTPLTFEHADFPEFVDITTCSLDQPERLPPKDHTQTRTSLAWVEVNDALPRYLGVRSTA
ncbi:MAG: hypothetical protein RL701_2559 [Pseudomonadota bacterium]|jgi:hypothetical protein